MADTKETLKKKLEIIELEEDLKYRQERLAKIKEDDNYSVDAMVEIAYNNSKRSTDRMYLEREEIVMLLDRQLQILRDKIQELQK